MPPVITSVSNSPLDGKKVVVTLQDAPTGTLTFYASRTPGTDGATCATVTGGPTVYTVTVRSTETVARMAYYITAQDNTGKSSQGAVWLSYGSPKGFSRQAAQAVYNILVSNRAALDKAMQDELGGTTWPSGKALTVPYIVLGPPNPGTENSYPLIAVEPGGYSESLMGEPMGKQVALSATVHAWAIHQSPVVWEPVIISLGEATAAILNQLQYIEFQLPCGIWVQQSEATAVQYMEEPYSDKEFLLSATVPWQGLMLYAYSE